MLRLNSLCFSYPGQGPALRGIDAAVPIGLTLLTGPNAGGKTTLLRTLAGLLTPSSGTITRSDTGQNLAEADLRRLGRMVMQDADAQILGAHLGEDVMLGRAASNLKADFAAEAERLALRFNLKQFWHEQVESLSYGQKRKLCLMHALLAGPEVLLLDEPFAGLDYPSARELREFVAENRQAGLTQIISTHELEPVFDLADWLIVIEAGIAVAEGKPADLRDRLPEWSVRPPGGKY